MRFHLFPFLLASLATAIPAPQQASTSTPSTSTGFWMGAIQRQGTVGYGSDPAYKVFRNVKEYGAVGDGTTDDTAAINKAIAEGNRCFYNEDTKVACDSSTTTPALVYFPPGTYQISSPIVMYYYTQLIGDATNLPVIRATSNFEGFAMLDANPYIVNGYGANWYTNQNNFYRQVRNFVIDMTQIPATPNGGNHVGVHWQVAQATSLQNIRWEMAKGSGSAQIGLMIENGSGGFISDLIFNGGTVAMNIGSQQFTSRNITISDAETAVFMIWNWLWTFKSMTINNVQTGFDLSSVEENGGNQTVGSAVIMDSVFKNTKVAILTSRSANTAPKTGGTLIVHNVDFGGAQTAIAHPDGNVLLPGGSKVDSWAQGDVYMPTSGTSPAKREPQGNTSMDDCSDEIVTETVFVTAPPSTVAAPAVTTTMGTSTLSAGPSVPTAVTNGSSGANPRPDGAKCMRTAQAAVVSTVQQGMTKVDIPQGLLDGNGGVFQRSKPQYESVATSSFISVKSKGAKGDGTTDDTAAIQRVLNEATADQVVYFDHGAYLISDTVQIPKNIRIVGEIWPVIMISGAKFADPKNPVPAFRVGQPGDTGAVEISDLIFETRGPTPGAIMMEWNVADAQQGSCAMWDTHFRVGGTAGTLLQQDKCRNDTTSFVPECAASFLMMHITQQATAYLENTWFWLADHELDLAPWSKLNIFNGRGILIESQGPTWLWGTASEHNVLYNYQINNAKNVFMGAIQTETPYFQSAPNALQGGFTPDPSWNDPDFSDCTTEKCKKAWGLRVVQSEDVYMFGGGLYSFFEGWDQTCVDPENCQENMVDLYCSSNVYLYGLVTKAASNMVTVDGQSGVKQEDHTSRFGATLALFNQQ